VRRGANTVRRNGRPRSDQERLKRHFGRDWRKHSTKDLPPRGTGRGVVPRRRATR